MRRHIFILLCFALIIASCQSNSPGTASESAQTESPTNQIIQASSQAAPSPQKAETDSPTQTDVVPAGQPAGCTVVSPRPTPGPTERSIFPPVSDQDWISGAESTSITLVEYSDFQ
ncbi:MAG TPA: hypothetical protein VLA49_03980 [Anaerolineales bacterium]|nr:hypothetical protein [Anaerolineales bacterium]